MRISTLSEKEIRAVTRTINELINENELNSIQKKYSPIKIRDQREDVYLFKTSEKSWLNKIIEGGGTKLFSIRAYKVKLGFLINQEFKIGIESLRFVARYCQNPIILSSRQVERFIYGKDVDKNLENSKNYSTVASEGSLVLVTDKKGIPIGYARLYQKQDRIHLKNIIDIGIYLRSEKTAF